MIVAAALCPCPPLLAAELTGQADILPELRDACAAAVARLVASDPDVIAVVGPDEQTGPWPPDGRLDIGAYAPALGRGAASAGGGADGGGVRGAVGAAPRPPLPLSLGIGALLLDEAGYAGPRVTHAIAESEPAASCLAVRVQLPVPLLRVIVHRVVPPRRT